MSQKGRSGKFSSGCGRPLWFVPEGTEVNSRNCVDLLKDKLLSSANSHIGNRFWTFQQDGAPLTGRLRCKSGARKLPNVIVYNEWPACSPDLNPMDYSVGRSGGRGLLETSSLCGFAEQGS
ncbi:unnamed protein product [Haemonchus placei]|uniref:DDE_3 domain-containing protein n=1 Tax=Haemonchus placei TaxID=6290 RepID=A0A0N4WT27_HAEPC|nr:unnamed protein product [Haemonchus placei]